MFVLVTKVDTNCMCIKLLAWNIYNGIICIIYIQVHHHNWFFQKS